MCSAVQQKGVERETGKVQMGNKWAEEKVKSYKIERRKEWTRWKKMEKDR